jgi:adenylate kinase
VRCLDGLNSRIGAREKSPVSTSSGKIPQSDSVGERRRVIIVGIPGVGKTTVVNKVVELLEEKKASLGLVNYGTTMMEEATQRHGLKSRDEMRKLPVELQRSLQIYAAERISQITHKFVIVDTHLFIMTREGFWPGMPEDVLRALKPTHLVLVSASVEEIKSRRETDATRTRDKATVESLALELEAAKALLFASSIICGCPALIVANSSGQAEEAAKKIINSVFSS